MLEYFPPRDARDAVSSRNRLQLTRLRFSRRGLARAPGAPHDSCRDRVIDMLSCYSVVQG